VLSVNTVACLGEELPPLQKIGGNYRPCFNGNMNTTRKIKAPECLCGCGGRTKGGRFLPGHDAKLKKALVADARAGKKRAANKLEKLGWSKFLTLRTEVAVSEAVDHKTVNIF